MNHEFFSSKIDRKSNSIGNDSISQPTGIRHLAMIVDGNRRWAEKQNDVRRAIRWIDPMDTDARHLSSTNFEAPLAFATLTTTMRSSELTGPRTVIHIHCS